MDGWRSEERAGAMIVSPIGTIDYDNSTDFKPKLLAAVEKAAADGARLVVNFEHVDFISSAGLRVLAHAKNTAKPAAVSIVLSCLNEMTREIFEISRFDSLFEIYDSVEAALEGGAA